MDMYTLLYLKWITTRTYSVSTGSSAQCYVAAGWDPVWGVSPVVLHGRALISQHRQVLQVRFSEELPDKSDNESHLGM